LIWCQNCPEGQIADGKGNVKDAWMYPSLLLNVILVAGLVTTLWKLKNYREDRKRRGLLGPWPIRQVDVDVFDDRFRTGNLGPDRSTEIRSISSFRVEGGITDFETWVLCNLARDARQIFELGTGTGKTTYLLAANMPANGRVVTLTLKPENLAEYKPEGGDDANAEFSATHESRFADFFFSGTPEERKIVQLFGDSKDFDESRYAGQFDLVFVDGSHARSYVENDSRKALRIVSPGGVVIWHDYRGTRRTRGVFEALNALADDLPLVHLKDTSMIAYRKPVSASPSQAAAIGSPQVEFAG
jgi:SAM-dependent methyltransferase